MSYYGGYVVQKDPGHVSGVRMVYGFEIDAIERSGY